MKQKIKEIKDKLRSEKKTNQIRSDVPADSTVRPYYPTSSRINVGKTERIISAAGGAVLTFLSLRRATPAKLSALLPAAYLLYRGATGHCYINTLMNRDSHSHNDMAVSINRTITIYKTREEVYNFWRQLENLPLFMRHVLEVIETVPGKSYWKIHLPVTNTVIEWNAVMVEDIRNQKISWRSLPDAEIENSGEIIFRDAPGNQGTEVQVKLMYAPPMGLAGKAVSKLLNPMFEEIVHEDIRAFKNYVESGEIPTSKRQPTGKKKRKDDIRNYQDIKRNNYESDML